jgi:hypothetical protein
MSSIYLVSFPIQKGQNQKNQYHDATQPSLTEHQQLFICSKKVTFYLPLNSGSALFNTSYGQLKKREKNTKSNLSKF